MINSKLFPTRVQKNGFLYTISNNLRDSYSPTAYIMFITLLSRDILSVGITSQTCTLWVHIKYLGTYLRTNQPVVGNPLLIFHQRYVHLTGFQSWAKLTFRATLIVQISRADFAQSFLNVNPWLNNWWNRNSFSTNTKVILRMNKFWLSLPKSCKHTTLYRKVEVTYYRRRNLLLSS